MALAHQGDFRSSRTQGASSAFVIFGSFRSAAHAATERRAHARLIVLFGLPTPQRR